MIQKWWHDIWVGDNGPVSVHLAWHLYFKKNVRDYIRHLEKELNKPEALENLDELVAELQAFGHVECEGAPWLKN